MASKIRLSDVIKGNGAEFIFFGQGAPVIISGGQRYTIDLVVDSNSASIFLSDEDRDHELCRGSISDVTETYQNLLADLRRIKSPSVLRKHAKFLLGTIVGAVVASAIAVLATTSLPAFNKADGELSDEQVFELLDLMKMKTSLQAGPNLQSVIPPVQQIVPQLQMTDPRLTPSVPPIMDRPDFLKKPEVTPPATGNPTEEASQKAVAEEGDPDFVLPAFDPEAFKAMAEGARLNDEETEATEPEIEPVPVPEAVEEVEAKVDETPVTLVEPDADVEKTAGAAPEAEKEPAKEASKTTEPTLDIQAPASDNTSEEAGVAAFVPPSLEETRQQANEVVSTLLRDGMTPGQATDVLQTLEALAMADFGEITPEMFARLPHEVAQLLRDNGLVDMMEPAYTDGVPHRIIRLPDDVLDQYRGKDGIPTIPEANTWAATGNWVRIPPPGGGDLKSPEDFAAFGIQLP